MKTEELFQWSERYLAPTYRRAPMVLVRGEGARVWDSEGKAYYDFVSGIAVNNLGHCHPEVVEAIRKQAGQLLHVSNLYHIEPQAHLGKLLVENSFADRAFFCNSGAEANEAAIKLARRYAYLHHGEGRAEILAMEGSFHGRTMATLTATGQSKFWEGYAPLLPGLRHIPFGDLAAAEAALSPQTCAILVEPIQGEGGVKIPPPDYLPGLRRLCDRHGLLLIYDEVQTGMGRTGTLFAYEDFQAPPDIMTLAKALAGGVPIGAMLAREEVMQAFTPGSHASTFGGNPLASAAAVAAVQVLLRGELLENCRKVGRYLMGQLEELKGHYTLVKEVRGKGLMIGMELEIPGAPIVDACRERGFLINCTVDRVIRLVPPLVITEREVDQLIAALDEIFGSAQS
ncbi:MAG: acetylornithine transaminase [Candidatus Tectomicrobia bacterium]|uniref:Acetylornithine aminotransferase n=1 Tax=Tectimicrobiota bacterium TaxID=2528274 RepID=A0A932FYM4_UNCTE|nr:acetylornithine transaminase [Candidatus Tectomicrobia bacterium]